MKKNRIVTIFYCGILLLSLNMQTTFAEGLLEKDVFVSRYSWIKDEAAKGYPEAQFRLAAFYFDPPRGSNFVQNKRKAVSLWKQAALQGHTEAQYNLGLLYSTGIVVRPDEYRAIAWLCIAAENQQEKALKVLNKLKKSLSLKQKRIVQTVKAQLLEEIAAVSTKPKRVISGFTNIPKSD